MRYDIDISQEWSGGLQFFADLPDDLTEEQIRGAVEQFENKFEFDEPECYGTTITIRSLPEPLEWETPDESQAEELLRIIHEQIGESSEDETKEENQQ